ncbi:MAG: TIR domain-containing protein [Saprospiraceae bacterium]|nr:TIR domain-containing protein [Saprospiraceae bacterium]
MNPVNKYHTFLSHSHSDADLVEQIAKKLQDEYQLEVFLDKWILVPGQPFPQALSKGLDEAETCTIFIGSNTPTGWFRNEVDKALNKQAKDSSFRVIPVLLPNANDSFVGDFLELRTWIKFKSGIEEPEALHQLVSGIVGRPPGRIDGSVTRQTAIKLTVVPQRSLSEIIGRQEDLQNLRMVMLDDRPVVLVNGMGGIGKTTLAEGYMVEYGNEYRHLVWLNAESGFKEAVVSNYRLTENLKLKETPADQKFDAILFELDRLPGPNLMIIDNATCEFATYRDVIPQTPNWHILLTSRERIGAYIPMELDFLTEEYAMSLFKEHCDILTDEEVRTIVRKLEKHTLVVEIVAKAATRNRWSYAVAMSALEEDANTDVKTKRSDDKAIDRIKTYLISLFNISRLNANERWILKQFCGLPGNYITFEFLYKLLHIDKLEWKDKFASSLENLYESGYLQKNEAGNYKMHAVLKETFKTSLKPGLSDMSELIENVSELIFLDQSKDNPVDKFPFMPFGETLLELFPEDESSEIAALKSNLALVYKDLGDYEKARDLLEGALKSDLQNFGELHPNVARSQSNLALVYQDLGIMKRPGIYWKGALKKRFAKLWRTPS